MAVYAALPYSRPAIGMAGESLCGKSGCVGASSTPKNFLDTHRVDFGGGDEILYAVGTSPPGDA